MLNTIAGQQLTDSSNGYRAFKIEVLNDIVPHLIQDQYQTAEVVITALQPGLADHRAAHGVAPPGLGRLQEGRQPGLRAPVRQGHRDHLAPGEEVQPAAVRRLPGPGLSSAR